MNRHKGAIPVAAACLAVCAACGTEPCRVVMTDVDRSRWDDTATVVYENSDTVSLYDMSVVLHVTPGFGMRQLTLDMEILSPDSMRMREQLTLATVDAGPAPASYGGDMELPYRRRVRLHSQGSYTVNITPRTPVAGVESAGVAFQPVTQ